MFGAKMARLSYDILRGLNTTVWGGVKEAEKVGVIVKSGLSGADLIVGTSNALEDLSCNDLVCASLDILGTVSTAVGLVLGNLPPTKHLTVITGSVTVGCRSVRYYCKTYGTFWSCTAAAGHGIKEAIKFTIKK
jgi:hypothetical protein